MESEKSWSLFPRMGSLKFKVVSLNCSSVAISASITILVLTFGKNSWWIYLLYFLFLVGTTLTTSYLLGHGMTSSINLLIQSIQNRKILEEEDLLEFDKNDEVGKLAKEVSGMIHQLQTENIHSLKLITSITDTVNQLSKYSGNILTISHEQATGASEQATAIQEAFTTSKEIAVTSKEIATNAVSVNSIAEKANGACGEGNKIVSTAIEGMEEVKGQVSSLAERMLELGKSNQKIGKVVDIIDEISERTNLLALNAAIEAAGAGSAGKRFGIVASEIRRLAEKTVEATLQIKTLIDSVQEVTNATIMSTEKSIQAVGESFSLVQHVGEALGKISDHVQRTSKAAREISFSTQQQTSASEQMSVAIAEVNQVAEHVVRGSEETAQAIEELNELTKNARILILNRNE